MPIKPMKRKASKASDAFDPPVTASIAKLFDIGPYDRNQLSLAQLNRLREMIDVAGLPAAAERVGVDEMVLLRVCAGFGHRLRPETAARVRAWLAGGKK